MHRSSCSLIRGTVLLAILAGCSAEREDLAARVNQAPITRGEVDALLAERDTPPSSATNERRAEALAELITQNLLVQEAYRLDLQEEPGVKLAIKDVLAKAYLQRRLADLPQPQDSEIEAYYDSHPELFGERRRYQLQEIGVQAEGPDLAALKKKTGEVATLQELVTWLNERGLEYQAGATIKTADELPQDLLRHLKKAREGEVVKIATPIGLTVMQVVRIMTDPVPLAEVRGDIVKYLRNRRIEARLAEIKAELKADASIEKFPPFDSVSSEPEAGG